jgi:hypothetical protein
MCLQCKLCKLKRFKQLIINCLNRFSLLIPAVNALAKNFPKVATFGKLSFDLCLFYHKSARNTEGVLLKFISKFLKRNLLIVTK